MSRTWTDGSGLALSAANLNAMESDIAKGLIPGSVYLSVSRTGAATTLLASTWTTYPHDTLNENTGGGTWDSTNYIYTIPATGLYLSVASIRIADNQTPRSVGIGVGTSNADGAHVSWSNMGISGAAGRDGRIYTRLTRFNAGDLVRHYVFSDSSGFTTGGNSGQYFSILRLG